MTAYTWQTLLLLSVAYFLGCWIACLVRRMVARDTVSARTAPALAQAVAIATPTAPRPVERAPTSAPVAVPVRDGFRRADTLEPSPQSASRPQPTAKPVTPAASGSADTVSRFERALTGPDASQPPAQPASPAPPAGPIVPPSSRNDDLKRIRNIDGRIEAELRKLGITSYSQIGALKPADVARINQVLGTKARIEQENWIEQAQILAAGKDTFYSSRLARGEIAGATPIADEGTRAAPPVVRSAPPVAARAEPPQPIAPSPPPAQSPKPPAAASAKTTPPVQSAEPARTITTAESAAAAAAALAAAAAAARSVTPRAEATPPASSSTSQPDVSGKAAFAGPRELAPVPSTSTGSALPSALPPIEPGVSARDDLQRIRGVTPEIERMLQTHGVTRFRQIAEWSREDTDRFDRVLGLQGRVQRENWIEQAELLSRNRGAGSAPSLPDRNSGEPRQGLPMGRVQAPSAPLPDTPPARLAPASDTASAAAAAAAAAASLAASTFATPGSRQERPERSDPAPESPSTDIAAPRPNRLVDAIRDRDQRGDTEREPHEAREEREPREPRSERTGLSGFRSVRSEAFRGGDAAPAGAAHDLKRIRGIGVLIEKKLNSMGITRYEQVAEWTVADIERVSRVLDFKGRIERENWVEQARILASGGQTEFSRRADRGDLG